MSVRHASTALVAAAALVSFTSVAAADPPPNNPQVQYRSFSCNDAFFLVTSTGTFAIKVFTEIFPSGEVKTFNYGVAGFRDKELLTCSYTDPAGVVNVFQGFLTPRT